MKLPRRQFLHVAAGTAALPVISRNAKAQTDPARPATEPDSGSRSPGLARAE